MTTDTPSNATTPRNAAIHNTMPKGISVGLAVAGGYCVYAMHLAGKTMHEHYLGLFGIDANLFPRSLDDIATLGQMGLLERLITFFMAVLQALEKQGLIVLAVMTAVLFILLFLIRKFPKQSSLPNWAKNMPGWAGDAGKSLAMSVLAMAVFLEVFAFGLVMLMMPVSMGQSAGAKLYESEMQVFQAGCRTAKTAQRCVQLLKQGRIQMQGYVIDSSPTHIAIYDVKLKQARAVERNGLELRVLNPIKI